MFIFQQTLNMFNQILSLFLLFLLIGINWNESIEITETLSIYFFPHLVKKKYFISKRKME